MASVQPFKAVTYHGTKQIFFHIFFIEKSAVMACKDYMQTVALAQGAVIENAWAAIM